MTVWTERETRYPGAVLRAMHDVSGTLDRLELAPNDLVLVACSGGADSLALAIAAQHCADRIGKTTRKRGFGVRVGAVIVDHQLQAGSDEVAHNAADQCRYLGLEPVEVIKVEVGTEGGLEAAARDARYWALEKTATELGAKAVLLGHTLDDQAESVLLGLARGSGARSLSGMPERRGIFVRPLLQVRRETTELICKIHGVEPWHDPSNSEPVHLRNKVRLTAMPVLESTIGHSVPEALARTAEQLREDADALDFYADQLLELAISAVEPGETIEMVPSGFVHLDIGVLLGAPVAVRRRALKKAAIQAGATASDLSHTQILAMDALVAKWHGQSAHKLPGNVIVHRNGGKLWFDKETTKRNCEEV